VSVCQKTHLCFSSTCFWRVLWLTIPTIAKVSEETNRNVPVRNTLVQLLALYADPEGHNAQRHRQTDGRTGQHDDGNRRSYCVAVRSAKNLQENYAIAYPVMTSSDLRWKYKIYYYLQCRVYKKLSYRRETARQLPTWGEARTSSPAPPLLATPIHMV